MSASENTPSAAGRTPATPRDNEPSGTDDAGGCFQLPPAGWNLLSAAARITQESDRTRMDAELVTSLARLWPLNCAELFQVLHGPPLTVRRVMALRNGALQHHVSLTPDHDEPLGSVLGAEECISMRRPVATCSTETSYSLVFPIWNKHRHAVRLLRLDAPCDQLHQAERAVQALLVLYQNHLNLIEDSELDALTGLRNRRTFDHLLLNLLSGSAPIEQSPVGFRRNSADAANTADWLAVLDIDRFKHINDRYGHLFGDEVLILVANLMQQSFRAHDPLFRFGGEEFVVVLCGVDEAGATTALERFRTRLESQHFPQVGQITISTGFTRIAAGELSSEVLNRADAALYYAKEHGRNVTCCYEHLVESGQLSPLQRSTGSGFELF